MRESFFTERSDLTRINISDISFWICHNRNERESEFSNLRYNFFVIRNRLKIEINSSRCIGPVFQKIVIACCRSTTDHINWRKFARGQCWNHFLSYSFIPLNSIQSKFSIKQSTFKAFFCSKDSFEWLQLKCTDWNESIRKEQNEVVLNFSFVEKIETIKACASIVLNCLDNLQQFTFWCILQPKWNLQKQSSHVFQYC